MINECYTRISLRYTSVIVILLPNCYTYMDVKLVLSFNSSNAFLKLIFIHAFSFNEKAVICNPV